MRRGRDYRQANRVKSDHYLAAAGAEAEVEEYNICRLCERIRPGTGCRVDLKNLICCGLEDVGALEDVPQEKGRCLSPGMGVGTMVREFAQFRYCCAVQKHREATIVRKLVAANFYCGKWAGLSLPTDHA